MIGITSPHILINLLYSFGFTFEYPQLNLFLLYSINGETVTGYLGPHIHIIIYT